MGLAKPRIMPLQKRYAGLLCVWGRRGSLFDVLNHVRVLVQPVLDGLRLLALAVFVDHEVFQGAVLFIIQLQALEPLGYLRIVLLEAVAG